MDPSGKLIYTRNQVVLSENVQTPGDDTTAEGNRISLSVKEVGTTEIFATALLHSPNGRFVTVVGDGAYHLHGEAIRTGTPCSKTKLKCACIRISRREVVLA